MLVVATILGMLFFGIMGTTLVNITANNLSSATEDLQGSQAFYVAEGGMQYVQMNKLNGDSNFADNIPPTDPPFGANAISLSPGQFWVEYMNVTPDTVTVKITSRVGTAVRVIEQNAAQGGSGVQYVTMADGNLSIDDSTGNVFGDVAVTGSYDIDPDVTVNGNIVSDPDLEIPTIDFPTYEAMCDSTHSGNLTISANYTGDLCVTGNVTISAGVTYTGLLYVGGNLAINANNVVFNGSTVVEGNIQGNGRTGLQFNAQPINPDEHMPAILTQGNLSFEDADNLTIYGVVWTDGNLSFDDSDNLTYTGSFMTDGNVTIDDVTGLTLTFDADVVAGIPGLSGGGGAVTGSLSLSGWKTYAPWW